jgi:hypothetical protein
MARKTDGEKVDELMVVVATFMERLDNVRQELKDLKRDLELSRNRLWLLVPPILAALLSATLMALINFLSRQ